MSIAETPLHRAALATIAALDASEYPPTTREVWRWLFAVDPRSAGPSGGDPFGLTLPVPFEQVQGTLADLERSGRLEHRDDRWVLAGRLALFDQQTQRQSVGQRKWRRVRTAAGFLRLVPFVRTVAVCNTLALENAKPESDADLFIVAADGHLWTVRALVTAVVELLGLRRHGTRITDRLCLSFYVTESAADLAPLAHAVDPHLALWTAQMVPVLDRSGAFGRFRTANPWVQRILPNAFAEERSDHRVPVGGPSAVAQGAYESFLTLTHLGPVLESLARREQQRRMAQNWWSRAKDGGTDVVISDTVLKFHEADRRKLYRATIADRVAQVLG